MNNIAGKAYVHMTAAELISAYVARQQIEEDELIAKLSSLVDQYKPDGFMLLECQVLDSTRLADYTILPWGPQNTFQTVPDHPVSPRGLASDMSAVVAICTRENFTEYVRGRELEAITPASGKEFHWMVRIAERYETELKKLDMEPDHRTTTLIDLCVVSKLHPEFRWYEMLKADHGNFMHDILGIKRHINRETRKLENCFLPRYAS